MIKNRTAANAVDGDAVYEVSMAALHTSANVAREEAQCVSDESRIPQPSNLASNGERRLSWEETYKLLWQVKRERINQQNG
jgi:hypothetical protein